jgi:hypothetical protein
MAPAGPISGGRASDCSETPESLAIQRMEAEIVEDKKKAKQCECGHAAAAHASDGVGHCRLCGCQGRVARDDDADAVSNERDDGNETAP